MAISLVINYIFNQTVNLQHDFVSELPIYMGYSSNFYPNYDLGDPKILPYRGLYFTGESSAYLPPNEESSSEIYLGTVHTFEM